MAIRYVKSSSNIVRNNAGKIVGFGTPTGGGKGGYTGGSAGNVSPTTGKPISTVAINGNEVVIDGQGYSVAPGKMNEFLASKGISGSSYQSVVEKATLRDTEAAKTAAIPKAIFINKLEQLKNPENKVKSLNANVQGQTNTQNRSVDLSGFGQNKTFNQIVKLGEKSNTVTLLTNEDGTKVTGVEYRNQSFTPAGFEKTYGAKPLYDPDKKEFFFGTPTKGKENKPISVISAGYQPITQKELNTLKISNLKIKTKEVLTGKTTALEAVSTTKVNKWIKDQKEGLYNALTQVSTQQLDKVAKKLKEQSIYALQQSDLKTGNKKADLSMKTLGAWSYFGGSAGAYALNMVSGLGNIALGLTFKQNETGKALILATPAMLTSMRGEIYRTFTGSGNIEDFFGTAVSIATIAQTASAFTKLSIGYKSAKGFKNDAAQVKLAVKESQKLLKKEQTYLQSVIVKNDKQWTTFGRARQSMNGMKAKHEWVAVNNGARSAIIQKSIIDHKNVRITNFMAAKSVSDKILGLVSKRIKNNKATFIFDRFKTTDKIASYLSKTQARRAYTFVEVKNSGRLIAIDGKGAVSIINNMKEFNKFLKTAKFGKFSFTGKRGVGGSIEAIRKIAKDGYFGSEAVSQSAFRNSRGFTGVRELPSPKSGSGMIKMGGTKKTPFSQTFATQEQVQLSKKVSLSKGISNSVTSSQLRNVAKALDKVISRNNIALKTGFRAVVTGNGLMFFTRTGQLVSAKTATNATNNSIETVKNRIIEIVKENTKQVAKQGTAQRSAQQQAQAMRQEVLQRSSNAGRPSLRFNLKIKTRERIPLPDMDYKRKINITKAILGSKLAPSYEIYIGSGKKVKKLGGRYTPSEAISKGAYTIDRTKERTVRIVPTKQKANSKFKINYLVQAGRKFRNYRIQRGKAVRFSSTRLIEKRKFFNDLERLGRRRRH